MPEKKFTKFSALFVDPRVGFLGMHIRVMTGYFSYRLLENHSFYKKKRISMLNISIYICFLTTNVV